jgi:hypothetical protein
MVIVHNASLRLALNRTSRAAARAFFSVFGVAVTKITAGCNATSQTDSETFLSKQSNEQMWMVCVFFSERKKHSG